MPVLLIAHATFPNSWREAFDDIAMGVEVGDGEQRLLRDDLQDVPATA